MFYANSWGKHVAASTCGDKVGHVEGDKEFSHHQLHHIVMGGLLSQLLVVPTFTVHIERFKTLQQVYPERFNGVWDVLRYVVREVHIFVAQKTNFSNIDVESSLSLHIHIIMKI